MEIEKGKVENLGGLLLRQVSAINSNVTRESVRNVVKYGGLSWEMFEYKRKEDVLEELKAIEDVNESRCDELFDTLNEMRPTEMKRKKRDCILSIKRDFYDLWIMKCMYSVSECFQRPCTYLFCLTVIQQWNPGMSAEKMFWTTSNPTSRSCSKM